MVVTECLGKSNDKLKSCLISTMLSCRICISSVSGSEVLDLRKKKSSNSPWFRFVVSSSRPRSELNQYFLNCFSL